MRWMSPARLDVAIFTTAILATGSSVVGAASACHREPTEEAHVVRARDGRTIELADGRAVRLTGIELPSSSAARERARDTLNVLTAGRAIALSGLSDTPDRYGRQTAVAFAAGRGDGATIQALMLAGGAALATGAARDAGCTAELLAAEARARAAHRGLWAGNVIKNAESPGDILAGIGQFGLVEGKVRSVRQAGAVTYVNFGPRWTRDFAVTIPRRELPSFEQAGLPLKSLANRRIRVRGWVQKRGGPRIEASGPGQIELLEGTTAATSSRTATDQAPTP